jgi:hypothetical protein
MSHGGMDFGYIRLVSIAFSIVERFGWFSGIPFVFSVFIPHV